ncbi:endoplasmic reticulum-Golgi intermediate compartment protein 1-like [Clytia hemisphaerica]|uniref:Endoplasmic reticulum-Golgi intermediate compartment protein 1 n=1 Tax=Clytia hemisphaerica TaxID=252671 RepID=A0A7M5X375_9CNID|eukprot:TCONS_00015191-protein
MQFDIRRFDIYRKIPKDLTQPTKTGACVSILSIIFIVFLMLSELSSLLFIDVKSEMFVDISSSQKPVYVRLNVSLPKMACDFVGLDLQDSQGRHEVGFLKDSKKVPINNGEGCRFEGHFEINRIPGNFHLSTHSAAQQPQNPDMTHIVNSLQFGDIIETTGAFNAMGELDMTEYPAMATHNYVIKIVPTKFKRLSGQIEDTFQYSYAQKEFIAYNGHRQQLMPAIWFKYDFNPITIQYTEQRQPFYHFITMFCAIIGGTFTVAGIIDTIIYTAHNIIKKAEIGKLS